MPDDLPKPALLRSLGYLIRGLSAVFWGLPLLLILGVQTARTNWLGSFGVLPLLMATGLIFFGLNLMSRFQPDNSSWCHSLERTKLMALVNLGMSPFLFWWHQFPQEEFFSIAASVLAIASLFFLFNLNSLLRQLTAILPDETLRYETRVFTTLNHYMLGIIILCLTFMLTIQQIDELPQMLAHVRFQIIQSNAWLIVLWVLLPVAMTMALIWKIKEVLFTSLCGG